MKRWMISGRQVVTMVVLVAFSVSSINPAFAESPIKLQNWQGTIDFSSVGFSSFELEGTASHLGRFTAYGEVELLPGATVGSLTGDGVVVFEAANGDRLVGVTTWDVLASEIGQLHFSWRDFVALSDGTIVDSTGRFAAERPPGLVVLAIIAVLMGLLLPVFCRDVRSC
jgi:hypothetical protein